MRVNFLSYDAFTEYYVAEPVQQLTGQHNDYNSLHALDIFTQR